MDANWFEVYCENAAAHAYLERKYGANSSLQLEDDERELIDLSFSPAVDRLRAVAFRYYVTRCDDPHDAVEWLVSECADYVIGAVIAGSRPIPAGYLQWVAIAKGIRQRYWKSVAIVIDGSPVRFLSDGDSDIATRVNADRLQHDDLSFGMMLLSYAAKGIGADRAPDWMVATIVHWSTAANVSWNDRAKELGVTRETIKSRESRCKRAIRAGMRGELCDIS